MTSPGRLRPPPSVLAVVALLAVVLVAVTVTTVLRDPVELIGEIWGFGFVVAVLVGLWRGFLWGWVLGLVQACGYLVVGVLGLVGIRLPSDGAALPPAVLLVVGVLLWALLLLPTARAHCGVGKLRRSRPQPGDGLQESDGA